MISILDYGAGNIGSVRNALEYLKVPCQVISSAGDVEGAKKLIVPGVGNFGDMVDSLDRAGIRRSLEKSVASGTPFLGICLGLQILFEGSEESPGKRGLGILEGDVRRLNTSLKVPHIGWNQIAITKAVPLFDGIQDNSYFYFVHSYAVVPRKSDVISSRTDYGIPFVSSSSLGNVYGVQFHPEKSGAIGLRMLRNFVELC